MHWKASVGSCWKCREAPIWKRPMNHGFAKCFGVLLALTAAGCQPRVTGREELKAEILAEVMIAVRQQLAAHGIADKDVQATRAQLKREIESEILRKLQMLAPEGQLARRADGTALGTTQPAAGPSGAVAGRILRTGKGLPSCKVKLVRMVRVETMGGLMKVFKEKEGTEFSTATDEDGKYEFAAVPVGHYKLKWKLPGETGWIRRLRYKPDVTVEAGKTHKAKTIETSRRLISQ